MAGASDCQCRARNFPGFDPSVLRHGESEGRQMKQCRIKYGDGHKKSKNSPVLKLGINKSHAGVTLCGGVLTHLYDISIFSSVVDASSMAATRSNRSYKI